MITVKSSSEREGVGQLELVCVKSTVKFLRVGYANILLFIGVVFGSISWEFLVEIGFWKSVAAICAAGIFLLFVLYYSTFVSRISEEKSAIYVLKAFTDVRIPIASITSIRISVIGLSQFAKVTIEQEGDNRTFQFRLIAPATNIGTFKTTVAALEEFARRHTQSTGLP